MLAVITDAILKHNIKYKIRTGVEAIHTAEIVFHAMYGTYLEDMGILAQITNNGQWDNRKAMSAVFVKRSTKPKTDNFPNFHDKGIKNGTIPINTKHGQRGPVLFYTTRLFWG